MWRAGLTLFLVGLFAFAATLLGVIGSGHRPPMCSVIPLNPALSQHLQQPPTYTARLEKLCGRNLVFKVIDHPVFSKWNRKKRRKKRRIVVNKCFSAMAVIGGHVFRGRVRYSREDAKEAAAKEAFEAFEALVPEWMDIARVLLAKPQSYDHFFDKRSAEGQVRKWMQQSIHGRGRDVVQWAPPDLKEYFIGNPPLQAAALLFRAVFTPIAGQDTFAWLRYVCDTAVKYKLQSAIPDRSGFLQFMAVLRAIKYYLHGPEENRVDSPVRAVVEDARNGGLNIMPALKAIDKHFDEMRSAYPVEFHRGYGEVCLGMDEIAGILEGGTKLRAQYEGAIIQKADSIKPRRPHMKKILCEIRQVVRAYFGPQAKLMLRGSTRKRTDISDSDVDVGVDPKERDAFPERDLEDLVAVFESSCIEGLDYIDLERKALRLWFHLHSRENSYELMPCTPKSFPYREENYPLTRNCTDGLVGDIQQLDQLYNNPALQRGCRFFKDFIKSAGKEARGLKSFVAEHLLFNVAVQQGLHPRLRDNTGLLIFMAAAAPFRFLDLLPPASDTAGQD